jgi:predicted dienelactone hydrolase
MQSISQVTHWASRGFVVLAADHPGLYLKDVLAAACGQGVTSRDVPGEVRRLAEAVRTSTGALAFLSGRVDADRIGMAGHSAGGRAIEGLGDLARVLAPLAAGGASAGPALESTVIMGGTADRVVPPDQQIDGFEDAPAPKRLILLDNAGHLAFSAFCDLRNGAGRNLVEVARAAGVCGTRLAGLLFDCNPSYLADRQAWTVVNHATTAAFEAVLQCRRGAERELSATGARFSEVSDFREAR